jgi:uncharacterized protein YdcH (DUF465 family)
MPITTHDIRQSLLAQDSEFRRLVEQHSQCESQLEELLGSQYMSAEDLIEEAELKKMKLRLKDRMELILARHQQSVSH